jgi:hypothetical protein
VEELGQELSENKNIIETVLVSEVICVTKIRCMLNIMGIVIPALEPPRKPVQKFKIMAERLFKNRSQGAHKMK